MMDRHACGERPQTAGGNTGAVDELQGLLEQQLQMARRTRFADLDELTERANAVIAQMEGTGVTRSPAFLARRPLLEGLYRELRLTLATHQQATAGALRAIRRGRKTVRAYRSGSFER